jgi:hypothetical protein
MEPTMARLASPRLVSSALLLALLMTALYPQPAFADEGTPPPDDPATSEGTPAADLPAEPSPDEAPATPVPDDLTATPAPDVPEAPAATDEASPKEAQPAADAPAQEAPLAEALAELPEGTTVAAVDAQGEPVPLVSNQAEAILASGDPIWCPASVKAPTPGFGGPGECSPSQTSMADLVTWLIGAPPPMDGIIWIEGGPQADVSAITLDGDALDEMDLFRLTLRGGWAGSGSSATTPLDLAIPGTGSTFSVPLNIINWHNDVTLMDILVDSSLSTEPALVVSTTGKATLTRVAARDNAGTGVTIDNRAGTSDVAVTSGYFGGNAGDGLNIASSGMITLVDVLAEGNTGYGAYLDNSGALTAKNVVLTSGDNEFYDNDSDGLYVQSRGAISIKDLTASGNGGNGAYLDKTGTAAITLTGVNIFAENTGNGLQISALGPVSASNLVADLNGGYGASIDNSTASTPQAVTLTGSNEFKRNLGGLAITSTGAITVNNLTASYNLDGNGATLHNDVASAVGDVRLTGSVMANGNYFDGLEIGSFGAVALANVTASGNATSDTDGYGAYIENNAAGSAKAVTVTGAGTFNDNYFAGLYVVSRGAVTLSKITASGNGAAGAYLDNTVSGPAAPQAVTLSVASVFDANGDVGLSVASFGAITIANLTANDNGSMGAALDNYQTGTATKANKITLTGLNTTNGNTGSGLEATSPGAIAIANLHALWNGGYGAHLSSISTKSSAILLSGMNEFAHNGLTGLDAHSGGPITLPDLESRDNGGDGLSLSNIDAPANATADISIGTGKAGWCNALSGNDYGLRLYSRGAITLNNMCVSENGIDASDGYGAWIDNTASGWVTPVVLKGTNSFAGNYSGGLVIQSYGAISANNLTANENINGGGAVLNNIITPHSYVIPPQKVSLTGSSQFSWNMGTGLNISSYGALTLNNLSAEGNGNDGIVATNYNTKMIRSALTIAGYANVSDNAGNGLTLDSLGTIKVTSLRAWGNSGYGASFTNYHMYGGGGITMSGAGNNFFENGLYGLHVSSSGPLVINASDGLDAWDNGTYGAGLESFGVKGAIILAAPSGQSHSFTGNLGGDGLTVSTSGPIVMTDINCSSNSGTGLAIDTTISSLWPQYDVIIKTAGTFSSNGGDGLRVNSYGAITLANITASGNGGYGANLDNYQLGEIPIAKPISLTGTSTFNLNGDDGLRALSVGAITASNLNAHGNGDDGIHLDNQWGYADYPAAAVTVSGTNSFEENAVDGLRVYSFGPILASNISGNANGNDGTYFETWGWWAPQSVTLTGTNTFTGNGDGVTLEGDGLRVYADGPITVSNIVATGNFEDGAYLDNIFYYYSEFPGYPEITLLGSSAFSENTRNGLDVQASGAVNLAGVAASENGDSGVTASSDFGSITLSCASLLYNGNYGFNLTSPLSILLKGVHAFGNIAGNFATGSLTEVRSCP